MWESRLFKTGLAVLLVFLIIYLGKQIAFIFWPLVVVFETLFLSFVIAGVLYYFSFPLSDRLLYLRVPRPLAITAVFLVIIAVPVGLALAVGPVLVDEFTKLANNLPVMVRQLQDPVQDLLSHPITAQIFDPEALDLERLTERLAATLSAAITQLTTGIVDLVGIVTNFLTQLLVVPFLLYYMLKERGRGMVFRLVDSYAPASYRVSIKSALSEINKMLGYYFQGLALVCLFVGVLAYLGFLVIGLDYALILAIIILITNVIPYLGPFIGAVPAVLVGLVTSPWMMVQVIAVIVIVQQAESLLISPQVMGRKMALSPLAVILIILVAGRLMGLLGIILAVPGFTVIKVVVNHVYRYLHPANRAANVDSESP